MLFYHDYQIPTVFLDKENYNPSKPHTGHRSQH